MNYSSPDDSHQPVMWLRGRAVYAAHFIVLVYVASMLVTAVSMALNSYALAAWLTFESSQVLGGQVWRILTYGLWNPPDIWFAIDMLMIFMFGREVEKFYGRRTFLQLFAGLYLITPLLFAAVGPWFPVALAGETGSFAIFVAFATLYPGAMMMFEISAMWMALILFAIFTLAPLAYHQWVSLVSLWVTAGFAFAFVRYKQGRFSLPKLPQFPGKSKTRESTGNVIAFPQSGPSRRGAAMAEVDALLDKIARSGIASLTAKERARLESARAELKRETR